MHINYTLFAILENWRDLLAKIPKIYVILISLYQLVPFFFLEPWVYFWFGQTSKRKEERKGESENSEIDRTVRSFEIRTKPSTQF